MHRAPKASRDVSIWDWKVSKYFSEILQIAPYLASELLVALGSPA